MGNIQRGTLAAAVLEGKRKLGCQDGASLVFANRKGTTLDRHTQLSRQLKPVSQALGLGNVNWHLLRHSNAILHDSRGTPLGTVQALLRHSSSEITRQVYLHSLTADRKLAAEKLEAHFIGPKSGPSFALGTLLLPGFVGAEGVDGRGDRI